MAEKANQVTIGYWAIRGLGQVSRFLLEYTGQQYQEKRYSDPQEWFGKDNEDLLKRGLFWHNLPYLIDGDFLISESTAIEEYIIGRGGKTADLVGKDNKEQAQVRMLVGVINDLRKPLVDLCYNENFEKRRQSHYDEEVKPFLDQFLKFFAQKKFLLGDQVKYCDFILYETLSWVRGVYSEGFKQYPKLNEFMTSFESLPKIKEYLASNRYIKAPFTSPAYGKWTGL